MKSLTDYLWFELPNRRGFVNITDTVEALVRKSGVMEGLCLVNAMHISASVFINDNEDGLLHDYEVWLEKLAPHEPVSQYHHNRTGEDNADAHLKRQVMGREVVVAITKGALDFGPWEQIFYGEFEAAAESACWSKSSANEGCDERFRIRGLAGFSASTRRRAWNASAAPASASWDWVASARGRPRRWPAAPWAASRWSIWMTSASAIPTASCTLWRPCRPPRPRSWPSE